MGHDPMANRLVALAALFAAVSPVARGQQSEPPPVRSPEVHADGRVTVRLRAPNARSVSFARDGAPPAPMQRDSAGVWSLTTEPLPPDVYPYTFRVDGVTHPDPSNPATKPVFMSAIGQTLIHVPGPSSLSWELNDVPRGAVTQHFYKSGIVGDERDFYVYSPPNYDPRRGRPYPVLYLLHGFSDDASAWVRAGRTNVILDNLIAQGKAQPMIVVMPLGYGAPEIMGNALRERRIDSTLWRRNTTVFVDALLREVIPRVERTYRVGTTRELRAVAGLSMGGGQALIAGLHYPDRFAYVGAFSSAVTILDRDFARAFPRADASLTPRPRLLWVAIGKDDFLYADNVRFRDWLRSRNVPFEWVETEGGHTWMVWRRYLTDFAPRLFR
jgi:enterochelin esterase family protein